MRSMLGSMARGAVGAVGAAAKHVLAADHKAAFTGAVYGCVGKNRLSGDLTC